MRILFVASMVVSGLLAHPYIYVYTPSLYAPGDETEIRLEATGLDEVHFRLYRIENPTDFFAHQSNLRSPKVSEKTKPANFFHMLGGLRDRTKRNTRYLSREIISEPSRVALRDFLGLAPLEQPQEAKPEMLGPASIPRLKGYEVLREWTYKFEKKKRTSDDYYYYDSRYRYADIDLELAEPGVYLVEAYYGNRVAYTPVVVSEISLVAKQDPNEVFVFALSSADGKPRRGAKITVLCDTHRIAAGRTNRDGLFRTQFDTTNLRVLVEDGKNFALLEKYYYYYDEFEGEGDGGWWGAVPSGKIKIYLQTERPIYRPEQMVYFKGTLRRVKDGLYLPPRSEDVEVKVTDPQGNEIYKHTLEADSYGSFADSLILPSSGRLGRYTLSATLDSTYHSVQFRVEEYRKPEFKVEVETDKRSYVQGDEVTVEVAADYFFGAPVVGGKVALKVYRREYYDYYWYYNEYVGELEAETDGQGKVVFKYPTPKEGQSYRYTFEAEVRDESMRAEKGEASAYVAEAGVLVDARPEKYVTDPGKSLRITIRTKDILGKPVSGNVELLVYRNYWDKEDKVLARKTLATDASGQASFAFTPSEAGSYYVKATTRDSQGNTSDDQSYFYASRYGEYYTWQTDEIQIIFDKETYKVGDRAEALVITPYQDAHFISSIEADEVYDVDMVDMKGSTALLRFKIRPEYVPNVYLAVCGFYEGEYFEHKGELKVELERELLTVEVTADKERYEPGEQAKLSLSVRDSRGKPVSADLSLAVVDEALYSLASEIVPSVKDYFYAERYDQVATVSSAYFSFYGYERAYRRLSRSASDSVVLAAYKGREEPKVRRRFEDVAYWNAFVRTDSRGKANVSFVWPDNLTTWRATARAVTKDTKVGEARQKSLVTKDLLVRLEPPRFFMERDSLVIPTVVHNYTRQSQEIELSFSAIGLASFDKTTHKATVSPGGTFRVDWPVRCEMPGDVTLVARAIGSTASDAMELTIPALPHGIERNLVISAFLQRPSEDITRTFSLPQETQLGTITADLTLSPTIGSAVFAGLAYLAKYPYGCVEQTMSCFFPDLVVADLLRDPKRGDLKLAEELPKMIDKSLAKLYGYQHADGGWGWFETDETMHFNTTYVMHGLLYTTALGYEVNPTVIERGLAALRKMLTQDRNLETVDRAYMVYVLTMAPGDEKALVSAQLALLEKTELDPYSQALMALTYQKIGESAKARAMLERIRKNAITDAETAYWSGKLHVFARWEEDPVEITATTLRAFLAISPQDEVIPKIVLWLLKQRRGDHWKSSKDSALALLALAEFFKTTKDTSPSMEIEFVLNNRKIASYSITQNELLEFSRPLELKLTGVSLGENKLQIHKKGEGNLFFSLAFSYYSTEEGISAGGSELKVQRMYYRLVPKVEGRRLVYDKVPLKGPVKVGEPIFVKLFVSATDDFEYVMVTDPIPAGCEVAKDRERYPVRNERYWWGYYDYDDWGYMYSGREIHDDHVAFFSTYLWDSREYSYVLEPYLPGVYHTMPAVVSLMYFPDKRGHSSEEIITVVEE